MKCPKCNSYIDDNSDECIYCKTKKYIIIFLPIFCIALFLLARNGKPELLRSIKGSDFINFFPSYAIIIFIIEKIIMSIFSKNFFQTHTDVLFLKYGTQELLTINDITNYEYTAYILLKLKVDNVIKFMTISSEDGEATNSYILLNSNFTDFEKYYNEFPDAHNVIFS